MSTSEQSIQDCTSREESTSKPLWLSYEGKVTEETWSKLFSFNERNRGDYAWISNNEYFMPNRIFSSHGQQDIRNIMCIWFHDETIEGDKQREIETCLNRTFDYIRIFTELDSFTAYLNGNFIIDEILFIISGRISVKQCHDVIRHPRHHKLYILRKGDDSTSNRRHFCITVVHRVRDLLKRIEEEVSSHNFQWRSYDVQKFNILPHVKSSLSSFSGFDFDLNETNLSSMNKETLKLLLFQSLNKALLNATHDLYAFEEMFINCRYYYKNNEKELQKIDDLQKNYDSARAIDYYEQDTSLKLLVQEAFQEENIERIFALRFYIFDLHQQLIQLSNQKNIVSHSNTLRLYRSQELSKAFLQKLHDNIGCLTSIYEFFLATENYSVSSVPCRDIYENVLFELYIPTILATETSSINLVNYAEVSKGNFLFSLCSVWHLESMEKKENGIWTIILKLSNNLNYNLTTFYNEISDNCNLVKLADICCQFNMYTSANVLYCRILENDISDEMYKIIYDKISVLNSKHYQKSLVTADNNKEQTSFGAFYIHNTSSSRLSILNNLGIFYWKINDYKIVRELFKIALKEQSSPIEMAKMYCNYGLFESSQGHFQEGFTHFTATVNLQKDYNNEQEAEKISNLAKENLIDISKSR